uniref:Factor of DNA methylation 1-5/IDN2 domain-containing protein n=1 Tax=Tanacetum cinerariifolium TaxID=118510 RepID=A0A6L2P4D5_TANCI|nr:uncharacterized protein [Tanacetum cinerariifolium]
MLPRVVLPTRLQWEFMEVERDCREMVVEVAGNRGKKINSLKMLKIANDLDAITDNVIVNLHCPDGGNELALTIARLYIGSHDIISLRNGYHINLSATMTAISYKSLEMGLTVAFTNLINGLGERVLVSYHIISKLRDPYPRQNSSWEENRVEKEGEEQYSSHQALIPLDENYDNRIYYLRLRNETKILLKSFNIDNNTSALVCTGITSNLKAMWKLFSRGNYLTQEWEHFFTSSGDCKDHEVKSISTIYAVPSLQLQHDSHMFPDIGSGKFITACVISSNGLDVVRANMTLIFYLESLQKAITRLAYCVELMEDDMVQRFGDDHEIVNLNLQRQEKELELRSAQLQKREVENQKKRKRLAKEIEQNATKNSLLQEQRKANESMMKLANDHMREKEKLDEKIILLKKQLYAKHALKLEIKGLEAQLEVKRHMEDLYGSINEKKEELEYVERICQTRVVQERKANDELQAARKELIEGFKELPKATHIGLKRMGELDNKPFYDAMKQMYNEIEAEYKASELCSLWEEYLRDPSWHPFKVITIEGKSEKIIDKTDEKLKSLKRQLGEKVYKAVTTALTEINDYNPSGGYVTTELWKFAEGKKATLKDGVSYLLKMWDTRKRQKRFPYNICDLRSFLEKRYEKAYHFLRASRFEFFIKSVLVCIPQERSRTSHSYSAST